MNTISTDMFYRIMGAIENASHLHRFQRRKDKGRSAYIHHPIQVMKILLDAGVLNEEVLMAAVLHDTVEDTEATLQEIYVKYGKQVMSYVSETSDDKSLPKEDRKEEQIRHAYVISYGAVLIKLADKISNLHDLCHYPPTWELQRIKEYITWCNRVVDALKENITEKLSTTGVNDMDLTCYSSLIRTYQRVYRMATTMYV